MQLQKNELNSTKEMLRILQREKQNDKDSIMRMQSLIDNFCQEKSAETQKEVERVGDSDNKVKQIEINNWCL